MGVDIINVRGLQACIGYRRHHGAAWAVHIRGGHMARIGAHAKASNFGVNLRAARLGVLVFFDHHHARTLSQNETIAVFVPGA